MHDLVGIEQDKLLPSDVSRPPSEYITSDGLTRICLYFKGNDYDAPHLYLTCT